jgi:hypothetical protein
MGTFNFKTLHKIKSISCQGLPHYELLYIEEASVRTWRWRLAQHCLRSIVRLEKSAFVDMMGGVTGGSW